MDYNQDKNEDTEKTILQLVNNVNVIKQEIGVLKVQNKKQEDQIRMLQQEIGKKISVNVTDSEMTKIKEKELEEREKQIKQITAEYEDRLSAFEQQLHTYEKKFSSWNQIEDIYKPILDVLLNSEIFKPFVLEKGFSIGGGSESVENIYLISIMMGFRYQFIEDVIMEYLNKYRKADMEIQEDEIQLFQTINQYCQKTLGTLNDVIVWPEIGDDFDKNKMDDLKDRMKYFRKVAKVYTPRVCGGEYNYKALVKGE